MDTNILNEDYINSLIKINEKPKNKQFSLNFLGQFMNMEKNSLNNQDPCNNNFYLFKLYF